MGPSRQWYHWAERAKGTLQGWGVLRALLASLRASQSKVCAKAGLAQSSWSTEDHGASERIWTPFWGPGKDSEGT